MGKKGKHNQKNQQEEVKKKNIIISQEHLMDKTHMQPIEYIPFLPQDSLYPPFVVSEHEVNNLRKILKQLNYTLYLDFKNFWATLLYNPSFKICIHTCIQFFHRKWMNKYINKPQPEKLEEVLLQNYEKIKHSAQFEYTQALMKVVLLIYFRILHFNEQNSQLSNFYNLKSEIITKYILDFPRLLELIQVYSKSNPDIVRIIVKQFINLSPTLYSDFKEEVLEPMIVRMNKNLNVVKRTTDREEFGIEYNYKRSRPDELSPGQQELKKKICLLMQSISFLESLNNIFDFFPNTWGQCTKFNIQFHNICQNLFIEIEQAYKVWNNHQQGQIIYALMNCILKKCATYFVEFLQKCNSLFVEKRQSSNFKEAYMKCLDRMIQNYGKRQSLGKKAGSKRYMQLYKQILKDFKLDDFTSKLYMEETQNSTYGINVEYLVDFKIAIDEQIAKMQGRPLVMPDPMALLEEKTQADRLQDRDQQQIQVKKPEVSSRKASQKIETPVQSTLAKDQQVQDLDKLQILISKKNREDSYYQRLHQDYRTKITIEYEDQYDDLVDYEKRPMFENNEKQAKQSSVDGSGSEYDSQVEKLHLVKSQSNSSRARGPGTQYHMHQKYDRKNKAKFVPVKEAQAKAIINKEASKYKSNPNQKQKPVYLPKQESKKDKDKSFDESRGYFKKQVQYDDEECLQQCKAKIKTEQNQGKNKKFEEEEDSDSDDDKRDGENRGKRGRGRGGRGGTHNQHNKPKGSNTNKKKYVAKD